MRLNIPLLDIEELNAVQEVLDSGFLTQGPKAAEFEKSLSSYVGVNHAFAVSSATTGLHLALMALGVRPGDEVIIPDFSFPATANVIEQIGAIPRFVDIEPGTFNINPDLIEDAITDKTVAIMPVHAFGLVAEMESINQIAQKYQIPVIEDAACALSGTYKGNQAGSLGDIGVFSFHPRKIITTGEGGMVFTSNPELAEKISVLRSHGAVRGELFMEFIDAGYNYRLSDVHAAIGLAQMNKLDFIVQQRSFLAAKLSSQLESVGEVIIPTVPSPNHHAFQSYVIQLSETIDRDAVIRSMKARGVETTLGTYSMHLQPFFQNKYGLKDSDFPISTHAHYKALTLPLYPQLSEEDLENIVLQLKNSIQASKVA